MLKGLKSYFHPYTPIKMELSIIILLWNSFPMDHSTTYIMYFHWKLFDNRTFNDIHLSNEKWFVPVFQPYNSIEELFDNEIFNLQIPLKNS